MTTFTVVSHETCLVVGFQALDPGTMALIIIIYRCILPTNWACIVRMSPRNSLYFICRQIVELLGAIRTRFSRSCLCVHRKQFSAVLLRFFGSRWNHKRFILGSERREVALTSPRLQASCGLQAPDWLPVVGGQGRGAKRVHSQNSTLPSPSPRGGSWRLCTQHRQNLS